MIPALFEMKGKITKKTRKKLAYELKQKNFKNEVKMDQKRMLKKKKIHKELKTALKTLIKDLRLILTDESKASSRKKLVKI